MAACRSTEQSVQTFTPYEKMGLSTNLWDSKKLDGIKKWVAMEKIHGANFSFTVLCRDHQMKSVKKASKFRAGGKKLTEASTDSLAVLVARRGGYLREGEVFFGVEKQREFLEGEKEKARCICEAVIIRERERMGNDSEPMESVTIFGELFGGYYPHPSVPPHPGVSNVQKEVVYCPDLKFCAFDIAITSSQQESRRYLDYDDCMELFKRSGFLYAEPLATGTLQAMISYPLGFDSKLPAKFGLPPLGKPNVAEGIVIKPIKDVVLESKKGPKRVIFKRKVEGFAEVKPRGRDRAACGYKKRAEGSTWTPDSDDQDFELLRYEMLALVTTQRVVNVVSKLGRPSIDHSSSPTNDKGQDSLSSTLTLAESLAAMTVNAEKEKRGTVENGVEWKDIVRGLMMDMIEELESEHSEQWSSCQRDGKKIGKLMQEMRQECAQCIEDYKISLAE